MQRSHRALLPRRALANVICRRHQFYKVSLSLAAFWVLVFLFNLWISFGDGHTDGSILHPVGISTREEANLGHSEDSNVIDERRLDKTNPVMSSKDICESNDTRKSFNINILSNEEPKNRIVGEKGNDNGLVNRENNKMENPSYNLIRTMPLGLDEFKSRAARAKTRSVADQAGNLIHRVEPGGAEYNYASASKGAKVLASNKEAKGASNILIRDKDKYLRNPCSAEEKFVVVELSEETLVDTIEMANFEHYSSNLKDFELLGTLIYPTDIWIKIGNFTAANAKHAQRFVLQEPKWVRYLKVNLLSHYGSEFYCTLSVLEVYGVDAVERMLEDLISAEDSSFSSEQVIADKKTVPSQPRFGNDDHKYDREKVSLHPDKSSDELQEITRSNLPDLSDELRHHHAGRMPGDTVLKILMQKVRSLDINLLVLERYLEELNFKYGSIFKEFDKDKGEKTTVFETIQSNVANLLKNQDVTSENVHGLIFWRSLVSVKLDHLQEENSVLRSAVEKMVENQRFVEKKGIAVFVVCIIFWVLGVLRLCMDLLRTILIAFSVYRGTTESSKFCCTRLSSIFLVLSCSIIIFIQSIVESPFYYLPISTLTSVAVSISSF